jgi:hypothetical protein
MPMKVSELVAALQQMPADAEVLAPYDGGVCDVEIDIAWLSRDGFVRLSGLGDVIYHDDSRPEWAPTEARNGYWRPRDDD